MALSQPLVAAAPIQLQPGYKFRPTDEEIVMGYLRPRSVNVPLPSAFIKDVEILGHNPWDLLPEGSMEKFFFSQRVQRWPLGHQWKRAAGDGHWKTSGKDVPIYSSSVNGRVPSIIGFKKTLVFYHGKAGVGENTDWVMQEYSLVGASLRPYPLVMRASAAETITKKNHNLSEALNSAKAPVMLIPDASWVVCRIYKKRKHTPRAISQVYNIAEGGQVPFYHFLEQGNCKGTTSSSSHIDLPLEKAEDDEDGTNMKANTSEATE